MAQWYISCFSVMYGHIMLIVNCWFPFWTGYLAIELLTLLGPDTCYFVALKLHGSWQYQLAKSRILEEVSIEFCLFIRLIFSYLIQLKLCEGRAEVMESYQQTVKERCALIKDMHMHWSSSARVLSDSMQKIPNNELISFIARFQNYIVFCDTG